MTDREKDWEKEKAGLENKINLLTKNIERMREAPDFWSEIVINEGEIDIDSVKKELQDFYFMMGQVSEVYSHITGGRFSKQMYYSNHIISEADEFYKNLYQEDAYAESKEHIESLESKLSKALAALREIVKLNEEAEPFDMASNCEINMLKCASEAIAEIEGK